MLRKLTIDGMPDSTIKLLQLKTNNLLILNTFQMYLHNITIILLYDRPLNFLHLLQLSLRQIIHLVQQ